MADLFDLPFSILFSRLFTFRPKVYWDGKLYVAKSDWKSQLFCLGFAGRKVVVDPVSKVVRINKRYIWAVHQTRRIEFDWISGINYDYNDINPASSVSWATARQHQDLFTVSLNLKNGERVRLFRFYGDGGFVNDSFMPDWFYWSDRIEADLTRQDQEGESLSYVDVLSKLIGVPTENRY